MPTICRFYGISIMMFVLEDEHNPPHIHAFYSGEECIFSIKDSEIIAGKFPKKGQQLVKEFIDKYRDKLLIMWETQNIEKLEPDF